MSCKQCKPSPRRLIWVYTVCLGLSVPIFRVITVYLLSENIFCLPWKYDHSTYWDWSYSRIPPVLRKRLFCAKCGYLVAVLHIKPFLIYSILKRKKFITKTYLYNFDPLKPHFYIVKLGFTGVYIIVLFLLKNIDYWYSLEPPHRGGSNKYPQSMFLSRNVKNIRIFIWKL